MDETFWHLQQRTLVRQRIFNNHAPVRCPHETEVNGLLFIFLFAKNNAPWYPVYEHTYGNFLPV
jgi:hypothetical protein